jgi:hypothetical protein
LNIEINGGNNEKDRRGERRALKSASNVKGKCGGG